MNTQIPSPRNKTDTLLVHSIFPTLQGEGPFAGTPSVFVRLSNCNLQCPLCDTDYTGGRAMSPEAVVEEISGYPQRLVVITGGEPFLQSATLSLVRLIQGQLRRKVQIETNGTILPHGQAERLLKACQLGLAIVVSPKTHHVQSVFAEIAVGYKYVAKAGSLCEDGLPESALDNPVNGRLARPAVRLPIYLQPADEKDPVKNKANLDAVVDSCMRHGHILCVQIHKIVGVA